MYLTYDEYTDMGGTFEETLFDNLCFEACSIVDYYTFNRLNEFSEYPEAVKRCVFKLIDLISVKSNVSQINQESLESNNISTVIASQANDGVSVSYNVLSADSLLKNSKEEIQSTIRMYLSNVKDSSERRILYRGLYPGE